MNIKVSDLSLKYFGGYQGIDMVSFEANESMAILGNSLSGKSSLLRCIAGLEKYTGSIESKAKEMVFTFDIKTLKKNDTVYNTLKYPLTLRNIQNADEIINEKAKIFGIRDLLNSKIKELTESEKKLVVLTRALLRDVDLYLLDNPLKGVENRERYFKTLLNEIKGKFVLYATDLKEEAQAFNKIMLLSYKKCIGIGSKDELIAQPKALDTLRLLTTYSYEYIIINKDDSGKYYIDYDGKRIEVPSPISSIYDKKEVIFAKDKDLITNMYFDASTEYRVSKR